MPHKPNPPDIIANKIKKATTDSFSTIGHSLEKKLEVDSVFEEKKSFQTYNASNASPMPNFINNLEKSNKQPVYTYIYQEERPEISNLINIYAALSGQSRNKTIEQFATSGNAEFKKALIDVAVNHLAPITKQMRELMADQSYLRSILKEGTEKASVIADKHLREIKEIVGFLSV